MAARLTNKRQAKVIRLIGADRLIGVLPYDDCVQAIIVNGGEARAFNLKPSEQTPLMRALLPAYDRLHDILHAEAMRLVRRGK